MKKLLLFVLSFILILNISISTFASPEYSQKNKVEIYTTIPYNHKINIINHGNGILFYNNLVILDKASFTCSRFSSIEISIKPPLNYHILKIYRDNLDITNSIKDISKSLNKDTIIELIKNPYLHDYFKYIGRTYKNDILLKTSDDSYSEILIMLIILSLACIIKCIYMGKKNKK